MKVRAFSLIELLAVIAIIALLVVGSGLAVREVMAGRNVENAAGMVVDDIALAQQTALSKNVRVRWQIIEVADRRTGDDPAFRFLRLQIFDPIARVWTTIGRQLLPISISADTNSPPPASTLLSANAVQTINDLAYDGLTQQTAKAASVVFRPDGRTSLDPNAIHSLTLRDPKRTNNFLTIQIDPVSGRTRTFHP